MRVLLLHNSFVQGIHVEFMSELGSLPLMTTTPEYNVTETVKGTKVRLLDLAGL